MGSKVFAWGMAIITGGIIADVLIHPKGTTAAGNAVVGVLKPSYNVLLGQAS